MKKFLASLLLLAYFTVSTGFVVSRHFCMDRVASVQLGLSDSDTCSKCGMHKDGGCCRDEVTVVKLSASHITSQAVAPLFFAPEAPSFETGYLSAPFENTPTVQPPTAHGPPLPRRDVYLRNCVFRI